MLRCLILFLFGMAICLIVWKANGQVPPSPGTPTAPPTAPHGGPHQIALAAATFVGPDTNDYSFLLPVLWTASPSTGVSNYAVWWGPTSGQYTNHQDNGLTLSAIIALGDMRTNYYFAVTAQGSNGIRSAYSPELRWPIPGTNIVWFPITIMQATGSLTGPLSAFRDLLTVNLPMLRHTNPPPGITEYRLRVDFQQSTLITSFKLDGSTLVVTN